MAEFEIIPPPATQPKGNGKKRGRKAGKKSKRTIITEAAFVEAARAGELPLQYMLRVMRDPNASQSRRDNMAMAAAPYVHPRFAVVAYQGNADDDNAAKKVNRIERVIIEAGATEWSDVTDTDDAGVSAVTETS